MMDRSHTPESPRQRGERCFSWWVPAAERSRSAVAASDLQLCDRAAERHLEVSPARLRRWRLAGLLPAPDAVGLRPSMAPAGRMPRIYSAALLASLDEVVDGLLKYSRPGRPAEDLALLLFASRLPAPLPLVREGIDRRLERLRNYMDSVMREALARFPPPEDPGLRISPAFERAEAVAQLAAQRASSMREIRKNLRREELPSTPVDTAAVITRLLTAIWSEAADDDGIEDLMYAVGSHGLLERVAPDVPAVLEDDPSGFLDAARVVAQFMLQPLPYDLDDDEMEKGRDMVIDVSRVVASTSASMPAVVHYLGGAALVDLWRPDDLDQLASVISGAVHMRRMLDTSDTEELLAAVRDQGLTVPSRDEFVRSFEGERDLGETAAGDRQ